MSADMNRDEIIRMAREVQFWQQRYFDLLKATADVASFRPQPLILADKASHDFGYAAGVSAEREACAKEADHWQSLTEKNGRTSKDGAYIAAAIRGRGKA